MAINYARLFHRRITPQSQLIPASSQVPNPAGGYAWQVDDWTRLDRFLILGAEGGTYYIGERDLVNQNLDAMVRNLGKMTSLGLIKPLSDAAKFVVRKLGDEVALQRAPIHHLAMLIADRVLGSERWQVWWHARRR